MILLFQRSRFLTPNSQGFYKQPWRRPHFYTSYEQQIRLFNTRPKQLGVAALVLVGMLLAALLEDNFLVTLAVAFAAAIGAIGLNIVTGYAGQVSLGHAFFLALGAYTAAAISGDPDGRTLGLGITSLPVWLLASGVVSMVAGVIVAPLATRLRGLYLAVVTLGLVFLGQHIFEQWRGLTGGPEVGRAAATPELFGHNLRVSGSVLTGSQKLYLLMLVLLLCFALVARNLVRSKIGRAFEALRDRDVAAEIMGVDLRRYKLLAFAISSFYAGCCGALLFSATGFVDPGAFDLLMSVQFIAMIFIGGLASISGSIAGAIFVTLLPWATRQIGGFVPFISSNPAEPLNTFQVQTFLYGALIIGFLMFEPRGLHGIWLRVYTYWRKWPFGY